MGQYGNISRKDEATMTRATDMPWIKSYPPGIRWDQKFQGRPLFDALYETRDAYGDRPAFDFLGKKWNWRQVADTVDRMARGLQDMGVGKGVKVGLFLPNCFYSLVAYYAILRAGGIVVNFNPLYAPRELQYQIEDSETDIMVTLDLKLTCDKMNEMLHSSRLKKLIICRFADILPFPKNILFSLFKKKEIGTLAHPARCVWYDSLVANEGKPDPVAIDPYEDVAVLQYTGGTTGLSKGAMLTHANLSINVEQTALWYAGLRPGQERILCILPFFHVYAMTVVMNMGVARGFEIIALPRFHLDETLETIHKKRPTCFPAVPAIYNAINNHPKIKSFDLTSVRLCVVGGAPLPVEVKREFERLTGCKMVEGYGLSETSPVVCFNPTEGVNKTGTVGPPIPGTVVEIISLDDGVTPVAVGERGEVCISGPQVMKGYYNKSAETANVMKNGRLHTGDVGIMDSDGYVSIVDRIKDMIITNGYNVYPRNVEEAIYLHPGVEECIVAGIPDRARGEAVKAWIKPRAGHNLTAEDLKEFLKDKISPIEMPRQIDIRQTPLPKTMVGKLSRKDILAQEKAANGG